MVSVPVTFELLPAQFGDREVVLARCGGLVATSFRYRSGVAGLRIENGAGRITMLPFHGQQIWDARFLDRELTMRSMFDTPRATRHFGSNYGAFFLHCGATAMGNPGPTDTHPPHGELPHAAYDDAQLVVGEDAVGRYMELTGSMRDTLAFSHDYVARPRVRLHEGATELELSMAIENRGGTPLDIMYLGHVNFRPVDGGVLEDTVRDDRRDAVVRGFAAGVPLTDAFRAWHAGIVADPAPHRVLKQGVEIVPELVLTMAAPGDAEGWAHALQRHPDGSADFVSHRPEQLPALVRWMTRGPNQDAIGFSLPATGAPNGLAAARAIGEQVRIAPGGSFVADLRFGVLAPDATAALQKKLAAVRAG